MKGREATPGLFFIALPGLPTMRPTVEMGLKGVNNTSLEMLAQIKIEFRGEIVTLDGVGVVWSFSDLPDQISDLTSIPCALFLIRIEG